MRGGFDATTIARAISTPGIDPRLNCSFGKVKAKVDETTGAISNQADVTFDPDVGPLVTVVLSPCAVEVACRVLMSVSGNGEGEWDPFVPDDLVLVVIPLGDEKSGPIILGRLANGVDAFPTLVGGQDATTNAFAFRRSMPARVEENANGFLWSQSTTGAFLSTDDIGGWVMADGESSYLAINADFLGLQNKDGSFAIQIDLTNGIGHFIVNDSLLQIGSGGEDSFLYCSGRILIGSLGGGAVGHGATIEQIANLLVAFGALVAPTPITPLQVAGAVATASASPLDSLVAQAITLALAVPRDPSGESPGLALPGLLLG